ncbi:TIGR03936 family radical SAM-associated protein [bacterium]|nr:TIGR03936 family radical SAM-associated protein [bacterium]
MQNQIYKYSLKLTKQGALKYISHLDWQGLILKIFRRLKIKLVLSNGFNKMPKVAYSPALPLFVESLCEVIIFQTYDKLDDDFRENFKKNSPKGLEIVDFQELKEQNFKSLENYIQWAKYEAMLKNDIYNYENVGYIIEKCLSSDNFEITKKTKKGITKQINYRNSIHSVEYDKEGKLSFILKAGANENIPALRACDFIEKLFEGQTLNIIRTEFLDENFRKIF